MAAPVSAGEESPGSTGTRCRVTPGGGDPRESATESRPPAGAGPRSGLRVRVKGCGKGAPRPRRRGRHGKPHREQDRIGTARPLAGQAGSRAAVRVGRARRPATGVPDEWPSPGAPPRKGIGRRGQNPAYRPSGSPIQSAIFQPARARHLAVRDGESMSAWDGMGHLWVITPHEGAYPICSVNESVHIFPRVAPSRERRC